MVVSAVVDDGSGGTISAALSVGDDDVSLVVVLVVVVVVVVVVVPGVDADVVRSGTTGADGWCRELCAVWMTANTRISSSSTAAAPEA